MKNATVEPSLYRPCVGVMLLNQQGNVFVAQRIDTTAEAWQMPQGGIDEGELPEEAMYRELYEETGLKREAVMLLESIDEWLYYDLPEELIGKLWGGRYRGQKQRWYACQFIGNDRDINIQTDQPEFSEWKWVDISLLPDLIVPFKRTLYEQLATRFEHLTKTPS